jgi:hypothetical protein
MEIPHHLFVDHGVDMVSLTNQLSDHG